MNAFLIEFVRINWGSQLGIEVVCLMNHGICGERALPDEKINENKQNYSKFVQN